MSTKSYGNVGQSNGRSSRREVNSVSSTASASTTRSDQAPKPPTQAVESAVTRLLVSIKQLLESLTQWSELKVSEEGVSDVYVNFGNDFNAAVHAFSQFNIDMQELMNIPDDLRRVLEQCLAEDASPDNLELYLPSVRSIITSLLQGLRLKQTIYRKIHRESGHERTDSRSSRTAPSRREGSHRSSASGSGTGAEDGGGEMSRNNVRRSKKTTSSSHRSGLSAQGSNDFIGGFAPTLVEQQTGQSDEGFDSYRSNSPEYQEQRRIDRGGPGPSSLSQSFGTPTASDSRELPPSQSDGAFSADESPQPPQPPASPPPVPSTVKRFTLTDGPVERPSELAPQLVIQPSSPLYNDIQPPPTPPTPVEPPQAVAKSLAALKSTDVLLERRASKRFSNYNFTKIAAPTRERSVRSHNHPNRRSLVANGNLTPGDLAVLTEVDDEEVATAPQDGIPSAAPSRSNTPAPPLPALPSTPSRSPELSVVPSAASTSAPASARPSKLTIFLQLGREVKKVSVEPGLSFSSLRVLFVDKFSYNPGLENFPAIYIRDPSSHVQYELEDTDEVKDKCLLSLNIEPLDQIKQHIDTQIASLAGDLKELKSAVQKGQQSSPYVADFTSAPPMMESTPAPTRPTDRQFATVARRLSRFIGDGGPPSFMTQPAPPLPNTLPPIQSQLTGQSLQPQMTGASVMSDYTNRVVTDLKTQFDEVQNLRRDLGIMRQLYTEFMKSTKESLGTLRTQTQSVKQLANSSVGGARQYIDTGKKKLDTRSQDVLTEVEKLQDIIESVKDDVIKRQATPNGMYFKSIKKDMDAVATELTSLSEHIQTVKPMWKKTWEEELQNIVEEQQFLAHQEEFLSDLLEDHKAMVEVYGHVEKVITLRKPSGGRGGGRRGIKFLPKDEPPQEGLSNVFMEIRGARVDGRKTLEAIEANKNMRKKDLETRSDDLHNELHEFVGQKRLKMTGGAEEAERVRQKRTEATMKAMFNGASSFGPLESPTSPSSS
ncbi:actin interacting protein 3-domain-containing protein [Crepidotus variabilis]|uniref:Actin interacting protein 3-domain-containing protein n=1 Tax=Crepidotus variabilis TaxID=179855 RepID=A0A9P6E9X5_9AGAR|nr:actin interacting protein 3-domain-containing protein [Crepidotus variabilis]